MTVDPTATALEKEQAEMKSVIKEQMQEINDLAAENEQLKEALKPVSYTHLTLPTILLV